jgi:hypothetical protein
MTVRKPTRGLNQQHVQISASLVPPGTGVPESIIRKELIPSTTFTAAITDLNQASHYTTSHKRATYITGIKTKKPNRQIRTLGMKPAHKNNLASTRNRVSNRTSYQMTVFLKSISESEVTTQATQTKTDQPIRQA